MASQPIGAIVYTKSRTTKKKFRPSGKEDSELAAVGSVGFHTTRRKKGRKREPARQFSLSAADEDDDRSATDETASSLPVEVDPPYQPSPNHNSTAPHKRVEERRKSETKSNRKAFDGVSGTLRALLKPQTATRASIATAGGATVLTGAGTTQGGREWSSTQCVEDFMDERDAEEWGGPVKVRKEYGDAAKTLRRMANDNPTEPTPFSGLSIGVPPVLQDTLGYRLLKQLGWRDRTTSYADGHGMSTAYVPIDDQKSGHTDKSDGKKDNDRPTVAAASVVLSRKRLRRISLRQRAITVPPPKVDSYGIGFQPFADAPEFQEHRERRQTEARERARRAEAAMLTGGNISDEKFIGSTRNVYRASDLLGDEDHVTESSGPRQSSGTTFSDEQDVMAFETAEDFLGTKTVGGFSLRDDEDNVYDTTVGGRGTNIAAANADDKGLVRIGNEEFHHELQEPLSDSDDDAFANKTSSVLDMNQRPNNPLGVRKKPKGDVATVNDFAGALDVWAISSSDRPPLGASTGTAQFLTSHDNSISQKHLSIASDGRPPLTGFVLGSADGSDGAKSSTRWAGPVLPKGFELHPHEFQEDELPSRVCKKSALLRWKAERENRRRRLVETDGQVDPNTKGNRRPTVGRQPKEPLTGAKFSALKAAMESRFTKGSLESNNSDAKLAKNEKSSAVTEREPGFEAPRFVTPKEAENPSTEPSTQDKLVKEVKAVRTVLPWMPPTRLCQVMGIPQPSQNNVLTPTGAPSGAGTREHSFFEKEILAFARRKIAAAEIGKASAVKSDDRGEVPPDYVEKTDLPPKEVLTSIFEASSDEESFDEDDDEYREAETTASSVANSVSAPSKDGATKGGTQNRDSVRGETLSDSGGNPNENVRNNVAANGEKSKHHPDLSKGYKDKGSTEFSRDDSTTDGDTARQRQKYDDEDVDKDSRDRQNRKHKRRRRD